MPIYEEKTYYHWLVNGLLFGSVLAGIIPVAIASQAGQAIPQAVWTAFGLTTALMTALFVFLFQQHVTVQPGEVIIAVGFIETWRKRIPLDQVENLQAVKFSPLGDFGGWGIKRGRNGIWCYNTQGNTGVHLQGPNINIIIGTPNPEALLEALKAAKGIA